MYRFLFVLCMFCGCYCERSSISDGMGVLVSGAVDDCVGVKVRHFGDI